MIPNDFTVISFNLQPIQLYYTIKLNNLRFNRVFK